MTRLRSPQFAIVFTAALHGIAILGADLPSVALRADSAGHLELAWWGETGIRYTVESSTTMENWAQARAPFRGVGQPLTSVVRFAEEVGTSCFWRLRAEPVQTDLFWQPVPFRTAAQKAAGFAGGEMGQMPFTMAYAPSRPARMAIGIDTAGVYLSEDAGATWTIRRTGLYSNGVQSVAFDPVNPDILLAAGTVSESGKSNAAADGIYRSTDAGLSWNRVLPAAYLRDLAQDQYFVFADPGIGSARTILAVTHTSGASPGGIYRSTDGGDTWTAYPGTGGPTGGLARALVRHPVSGTLWLAGSFGIYRSNNLGTTWHQVLADSVFGFTLHPTYSYIAYAGPETGGILRTDDGGTTWTPKNSGLPYKTDAGRYHTFTSLSRGPTTLYAAAHHWGGSIPRSTDDGETWKTYKFDDAFYEGRYFGEPVIAHPAEPDTAWFLSSLHVTHDGGRSWHVTGAGLSGSRRPGRTSIAQRVDEPDTMMFCHIDFCTSLTTDGGDTWTYRPKNPNPKTASAIACDPRGPTYLAGFGTWNTRTLYRTTDAGVTWSLVLQSGAELPQADFSAIFWHPTQPVVYAGAWRSEQNGADETWEPLAYPVRALFRGNGDIVYALASSPSRVLKSVDRGRTWFEVGSLPNPTRGLSDIDVDPIDPNHLYVATGFGVFVYDGTGWTERATTSGFAKNHFGSLDLRVIAADPTRPGVVYAGQRCNDLGVGNGVFRSLDYGATWKNLNLNLGPELSIWGLTVTPFGEVWLGTDHGNFRLRE